MSRGYGAVSRRFGKYAPKKAELKRGAFSVFARALRGQVAKKRTKREPRQPI